MAKADYVKRDDFWPYQIEVSDVEVRNETTVTITEAAHTQIMERLADEIHVTIDCGYPKGKGPVVDLIFEQLDSIQVDLFDVLNDYYPNSYADRDAVAALLEAQAARVRAISDIDADDGPDS
jgi:hypothetical protein